MPTYRAYRLDDLRHIRSADWLQASDDDQAKDKASELCDEESPVIELWQGRRLVDEIPCEDGDD